MAIDKSNLATVEKMWRREVEAAATYRHLANRERDLRRKEILIRLAVCDYLRGCGYRVIEGSTGEEAQRVFRAGEPVEILFSDINLGRGMTGFALAAWVRENYPAVRILLTSGIETLADDATHLCDGPLMSKPYSHGALEAEQCRRTLRHERRAFQRTPRRQRFDRP